MISSVILFILLQSLCFLYEVTSGKYFLYKEKRIERFNVEKGLTLYNGRNNPLLTIDIFEVTIWSREVNDGYCRNSVKDSSVKTQEVCQAFCEANGRLNCVGIVFSHTTKNKVCFMCKDDVITNSGDGFGFYRRPGTF